MKTEKNDIYEVVPYAPEFKTQSLEVLSFLWGTDEATNRRCFEWKYENNPYTNHPLGFVVLADSRVVGFRGYFPAKWKVGLTGRGITVLSSGDTVVHPDHRRKGLSIRIGRRAMERFARTHPVFLILSAGPHSVPGHRRVGFLDLAGRIYITKFPRGGLVKTVLRRLGFRRPGMERIAFGRSGDLIVSEHPMPGGMSRIVSMQATRCMGFSLVQDETFFRWRFSNGKRLYVFYYGVKHGVITGYVVVRVFPDKWHGDIVDAAETDEGTIATVLRKVIKMNHFNALRILCLGLHPPLTNGLKRIGFKRNTLERRIQQVKMGFQGDCPVLIRPVKARYEEKDWFVEGLDIRKMENWSIKGICSDGA